MSYENLYGGRAYLHKETWLPESMTLTLPHLILSPQDELCKLGLIDLINMQLA
jgi:hypothetical protein